MFFAFSHPSIPLSSVRVAAELLLERHRALGSSRKSECKRPERQRNACRNHAIAQALKLGADDLSISPRLCQDVLGVPLGGLHGEPVNVLLLLQLRDLLKVDQRQLWSAQIGEEDL